MLIEMGQTVIRTSHSKTASSLSTADVEHKTPSERTRLVEVLSELHDLLEEYSPMWYTEEHHRRIQAVLYIRKKH